jgi:hypothetical protein
MLRPELPIGSLPAPNALAFLGEQPPPRVWLLSQNVMWMADLDRTPVHKTCEEFRQPQFGLVKKYA